MEITEIRVFQKEGQDKKLKAYTTVTFDDVFVVRNIKVIQGSNGLFIAMPSRKMKRLCPQCHFKNEVGSKFCNHCGTPIKPEDPNAELPDAKTEHRDIAHPITQQFREYLQTKILETYEKEIMAGGGSIASAEEVSSEVH
ncbi:MAG TPA: septation protein SpoVG family protein [Candidatus Omnitrophota bacterium]|nr:septation protein SpoVG family protein [Candidatus Omnitrophota bacterium]